MIRIIGALLCALPLLAIAAVMVRDMGWRATLAVWSVSLAVVIAVAAGAYLLAGGGQW